MRPFQKKHHQKKRSQFFRIWHRRIGFMASVFLLNLALTGLMLNHYESLSLHSNHIKSSWLLDWYGVKYPQQIQCLKLEQDEVCQVDNFIYRTSSNGLIQLLNEDLGDLISLTKNQTEIYLTTQKSINIYNQEFELIDGLNIFDELTENIITSEFLNNHFFIQTSKQQFEINLSTFEIVELVKHESQTLLQSKQPFYALTDQALKLSIGQDYREKQISQLKFIQDLHSGQILSIQGKLVNDLAAIIIILLAISGFITWQRRNK